jgi:hypothetical protein
MKKNKPSISKSYLDDFIWMSYRYCIGRHTIAAACHADTIKSAIEQNKDTFSEDRLGFYARDIRNGINSILHWRDDVSIDGFNDNFDAYSALLYEVSKHDNPNELKFTIDTATQTIYTDPLGKKQTPTDYDYHDLILWTKLANYLDVSCHRIVVTYYQDKIKEHKCYPFPIQRGKNKYEQVWCPLDDNLTVDKFVNPEYIIKIKEL